MTAIITASRWNAICGDYKTGSPKDGTAGILRLTTDKGTVLVPADVVDRAQLFDLGPAVATPVRLAPWSGPGQARPSCWPATPRVTGALCATRTTMPTTTRCEPGIGS
jgi:hypothetical protein